VEREEVSNENSTVNVLAGSLLKTREEKREQ
jgi:hypothetical protein